ncbi:hypothetical protein BH11BAC1_BH11BAC1_22180 [soil metagenome]
MKRITCTIAAILFTGLLISTNSNAQNAPAFGKGDNTIGVSMGVGINYSYYNTAVSYPAITLYYDHGTFGEVGPGTIGIGGIVGFKSEHYKYPDNYGNYKASWTHYIIAARGTYHLTILKDKNNKFDPYAGIVLGVRMNSYTDTYDDYYYSKNHSRLYSRNSADVVKGVFIGAKYNFAKYVGVFAELGYDISIIRVGLNFNF